MKHVLTTLLADLFSSLVFVALYAATGAAVPATLIAVVAGIAQVGWQCWHAQRVEPMQALSLLLVLAFGGAAWMLRYLPPVAQQRLPPWAVVGAGYGWAALMLSLGLANLGFAASGSLAVWASFAGVGSIGAMLAAFGLQYTVFRGLIRRAAVAA